jgi:ATP-dependent Clp protease ATP-binding subunit ClpA
MRWADILCCGDMNLAIPVYIEEHKLPGEASPQFTLRPLFFESPSKSARQLSAGMSKLAQAVRNDLDALGGRARQEELIPWTYSPVLAEHRLKRSLQLRRQTADVRLLVVAFVALDRRIAFAPAVPGLFFEVLRGQDVGERAREVITDHFRRREKDEGELFALPGHLMTSRRAWVATLELDVRSNPTLAKPDLGARLLALTAGGAPDGRAELQRVGRCLDWLYPDELERAVLREPEVEELTRLLAERARRPVLLVGPREVGTTALVHEAVYRRVSERSSPHVQRRNVWLLSPARLISGMSYVGQWEGRLPAVLEHAARQEHVLYFDDVLGLYHAGRSADSDLSVAAVMGPWVERRDVRLLAEITPEALGVLREQDRGMADLFHVLSVREPGEAQSRRILMHVVRGQEDRHRSRFAVEALPTAMELGRRYVRDQAMPGKAAALLSHLAMKYRERDVTRETVLAEFAARSGLSVSFLDARARLERREVAEALGRDIIGQEAALAALADVVAVAKARLNDPGRPLGTLLFLGPTGVGKTAAAKGLARYLYGDEGRLLRFDMNEYVDAAAPARLVGTFARPDGQLTAAVRRQPYCVLLLDEIEKAHPAVLDLLLQLLGEGRLTDAVGRTSDVTGAVVIMTSNLGTREAGTSFGLRPAATSRRQAFVDAAAAFFRAEFVNRIDRVVPFEPLGRAEVAAIANKLIGELFGREGLAHRRCVLDVDPAAMDDIVAQGYHPQFGARALKRAVERQLTAPIAARLAALAPDAPTVVSIYSGGEGITAHVRPLLNAAPLPQSLLTITPADVDGVLTRVEVYVNDVEARNAARDAGGAARVSADSLSADHFRYFAVREQIQRIDRMIEQIDYAVSRGPNPNRRTPRLKPQRRMRRLADGAEGFGMLLSPGDVHGRLAELTRHALPIGDAPEERAGELIQECAHLEALAAATGGDDDRVLLHLRPIGRGGDDGPRLLDELRDAYLHLFPKSYGFSAAPVGPEDASGRFVMLEMPAVARLLTGEGGMHLFHAPGQNILPVQVSVLPLAAGQDVAQVIGERQAARGSWRQRPASGERVAETDEDPSGRVIRVYDQAAATLDLRTGLLCDGLPRGEDLRRFVLAALPIPAALQVTIAP